MGWLLQAFQRMKSTSWNAGDRTFFDWFRWQRSSWCATLHPGIAAMQRQINYTHHTHQTLILLMQKAVAVVSCCDTLEESLSILKSLPLPSLGFIANHPVTKRLRINKNNFPFHTPVVNWELFIIGTNNFIYICWDCMYSSVRYYLWTPFLPLGLPSMLPSGKLT